MSRKRHLSAREERMWQRVTKSIRRLEDRHPEPEVMDDDKIAELPPPAVSRETHHPPKPYERPKASREELEKLLSGHTGPRIHERLTKHLKPEAPKPGASVADRGGEKRIQRGKFEIGPSLDLHGETQSTARANLLRFIVSNRNAGLRSVLVITGKGRGGRGVLRARFLEWIGDADFRMHVGGYARANQKHGGDGAFYVFLRRV